MSNFYFRPQYEFPSLDSCSKKKSGRYHGSVFMNVPKGHYVVAAYLEHDDMKQLLNQYKEEEIVDMALKQFNVPVVQGVRKKKEVFPYGKLCKFKHILKQDKKDPNHLYFECLLLTDVQNSDMFWNRL